MSSTCYTVNSSVPQLNNWGVDLLDESDPTSALHYFQLAFENAKMEFEGSKSQFAKVQRRLQNEQGARELNSTLSPLDANYCLFGIQDRPVVRHEDGMISRFRHDDQERRMMTDETARYGGTIYAQAIRLLGTNESPTETRPIFSSNPIEQCKIQLSIVIFNLALAFHLKWIESRVQRAVSSSPSLLSTEESSHQPPHDTTPLLYKAISLYKISHALIADIVPQVQCNDISTVEIAGRNPILDVLFMAQLNNLAKASYNLKRNSEYTSYRQHMHDPSERLYSSSRQSVLQFARSALSCYHTAVLYAIHERSSAESLDIALCIREHIKWFVLISGNSTQIEEEQGERNKCKGRFVICTSMAGSGAPMA